MNNRRVAGASWLNLKSYFCYHFDACIHFTLPSFVDGFSANANAHNCVRTSCRIGRYCCEHPTVIAVLDDEIQIAGNDDGK